MPKDHDITRRALIASAGATIATAALTGVSQSAAPAAQVDRMQRAASELGQALHAQHGDQFDALVTPKGALWLKGKHVAIDADERLHHLMTEWRAAYDAASAATAEAEGDAHMQRLYAIESEAVGVRPATLDGFAIKLLMLTNYGEFDLDDFRAGLLTEAEAITGYAPPATFRRA